MRILSLHNFYREFGGADAAALADESLLREHGHEVHVYARHSRELDSISFRQKLGVLWGTIHSFRTSGELRSLVTQLQVDVAYVHNVFPLISPAAYRSLHELGVPIVQAMHDFRFGCLNGCYYRDGRVCRLCAGGNFSHGIRHRCFRGSHALSATYALSISAARLSRVLGKISAYVCPTLSMVDALRSLPIPANRIFVRPLFIRAESIRPRYEQGDHVLFLGRLSKEKGVWTLLRAAAMLPHLCFKVAGVGPEEPQLREFISKERLSNVELAGFAGEARKAELLRQASCLVVPSECLETFGLSVLEAYAHGKPVIASNIGSLPYLVKNGQSGLLATPGDPRNLASTIQELVNSPERIKMGKNARELVQTSFSPSVAHQRLCDIFEAVRS